MTTEELSAALSDGACLLDSGGTTSPNLHATLSNRLSRYYARRGSGTISSTESLEKIQLVTATEALSVIERVQHIIKEENYDADNGDPRSVPHAPPLIGTRDLAELRTLLSMTFKWGLGPLMTKVASAWPTKKSPEERRIIDLTTSSDDYALLSSLTSRIIALLFPDDSNDLNLRIAETLITVSVINRHLEDLLRPSITLGWLPRSLVSDSRRPLDHIRPRIIRLFNFLPPSQTISALGGVVSPASKPLPHVRKTCSVLLSQQLLRPQGVRGLCAAVFGEGEGSSIDDHPVEKLEHVVRVLTTPPAAMSAQEYFQTVIPRIVDLLAPEESPIHKRVAAFSVARMLSADKPFLHHSITSAIILDILHRPYQAAVSNPPPLYSSPMTPPDLPFFTNVFTSLHTLVILISNADPSPTFISTLLTPIILNLYSALHNLDKIKTSDPSLKETLRGLLVTWGKIVGTPEGFDSLWSILESGDARWRLNSEGQIYRYDDSENSSPLSLLTPEDIRRVDETDDLNVDANLLNMYPDPVHFVRFLKEINRADVSSEFFVKLLEAYRAQKANETNDPIRTLLYVQIIVQMQTQMADINSSSNIFFKPAQLLSFVKHVLEPTTVDTSKMEKERGSLRLHPVQHSDSEDEGDSDDDTPGADVTSGDDEMTETSINLLLSILEANEELSARTAPILTEIFSLLEPLVRDGSATIRPLAQEARMILTTRLASTSAKSAPQNSAEESAEETYQKALKLLQDPILPVRAHGLLLLRQLVSPSSVHSGPRLQNRALIPAILSIFLQSIHDDDSYVYLNAIQGLAAMVDTFGKDVLQGLLREYTENLEGLGSLNMTQDDVDSRLRIGEALGMAIRRCGEALSIYADTLVAPLLRIMRSSHFPTTLRASSLSLLAECESVNSLAMVPYVVDLADAIIDMLQTESPSSSVSPAAESEATSKSTKLPPLRRAALYLLLLLFRETTKTIYNSSFGRSTFSSSFLRRAKTTLTYVASTDQDTVVRIMAREANEGLDQMQHAVIGL